jgi:hypothetical protein
MTKLEWNKIEHGVPEEGDECAIILPNGDMEIGKFEVRKSYTGKSLVGFFGKDTGGEWYCDVESVKYYMVMTRPEEVKK